jgi:hypothetical protein
MDTHQKVGVVWPNLLVDSNLCNIKVFDYFFLQIICQTSLFIKNRNNINYRQYINLCQFFFLLRIKMLNLKSVYHNIMGMGVVRMIKFNAFACFRRNKHSIYIHSK